LSREVEAHKARCRIDRDEAFRVASLNLADNPGLNFHITGWTARAREAYGGWASSRWNWNELFRRHHDPDRLDIAIWTHDNELAALALAVTTGLAVHLRFLEGAPGDSPALKGDRLIIVLEAVACYAQLRGKVEIRATPLNDELSRLYVDRYGFELVDKRGQEAYVCRRI
jgi:hypothetical protein